MTIISHKLLNKDEKSFFLVKTSNNIYNKHRYSRSSMDRVFPSEGKDRSSILLVDTKKEVIEMKKVCNVIICLIILLLGYFCFFKYILKVNYVALGPYQLQTVSSESMRPNIKPGDAVIVKETSDFRKGDVVCYLQSGTQNLREIVSIEDGKVIVRENYMGNEEEIESSKIIGKVTQIIPGFGNVIFQLTQPWTFFIVALFVGSYFAFVYGKHA